MDSFTVQSDSGELSRLTSFNKAVSVTGTMEGHPGAGTFVIPDSYYILYLSIPAGIFSLLV